MIDLSKLVKEWLDSKKIFHRGPFDAIPGTVCLETDQVHFCVKTTFVDVWAMQRPQVVAVRYYAADPEFFTKLGNFQ